MPAKLHVSLDRITQRVGREFIDQLTYPGIYRGSPLNVSPVMIEQDGEIGLVISHPDSDACKVLPPGIRREIYGRYFDWNSDMGLPVTTFAQAVRKFCGAGVIACQAALPLSRYQALAESGPVDLFDLPPEPGLFVYTKRRSELESQWIATRDADAAAFAPFVETLRGGATLVAAMTSRATGFAPLDALCAEKGMGALYLTAPHELEMFTGLPARAIEQSGISVLFTPGKEEITVLSQHPLARADFEARGEAAALADVLVSSGSTRIGIHKDHIAAGTYLALEKTGLRFDDAGYVIRRWQDRRAGDDAVYFIFTANAVLHGIAAARAFFLRNASGAMIERDLVAIYHQGVQRFARRYGFADRIGSYFDIVHSGARTLLPATAGDYPVGVHDKTIKFDMGLTVSDSFGCIRGVSDIARTICADAGMEAMHDRLRTILIDKLIPAIKPGMSGGEIHAIGVDLLKPLESDLHRLGLLPEGKGVEGYRRDCGHTIQRQTISAVYFLPGVSEKVEEGMLGCTEYVWPVDDILIAVEDGYLITADGGVPFTAEGEAP